MRRLTCGFLWATHGLWDLWRRLVRALRERLERRPFELKFYLREYAMRGWSWERFLRRHEQEKPHELLLGSRRRLKLPTGLTHPLLDLQDENHARL